VPAAAHTNILIGMVLWFWIVAGGIYAANHWYSQYFPISSYVNRFGFRLILSPAVFDRYTNSYNVSRITTPEKMLDIDLYKKYSPLFQGPRIALAYALSFASISSILVHAILYEGKTIVKRLWTLRKSEEEEDIHMVAMRNYPEVPEWWYQVLLFLMFIVSLASVLAFPTFLPWWGFLITMAIPIVFMLPVGILQARTSIQIGLNVITEFVAGYIWPGRPVANTLVKIYGYMAMYKGLSFVSDLKLGVYMKIPPRAMFRVQILGNFLANMAAIGLSSISTC
jgi:OPT family oligopeptide transporter